MIEIPGLRGAPQDDFSQHLRSQTKTPGRAKWPRKATSKHLDFTCVGWEDNDDETSADDISLVSWLENKALDVTVGNSKWTARPEWEKFVSVDIKSRCKALRDNQEWANLRMELNNRAITDITSNSFQLSTGPGGNQSQPKTPTGTFTYSRNDQLDGSRSSTSSCFKKQRFEELKRQDSFSLPSRKSFVSQSFVEDHHQRSTRLANSSQSRPLTRTNTSDTLKQSDPESSAFRHCSQRSNSHSSSVGESTLAKQDPLSNALKDRHQQELYRKQSLKSRRSLKVKDHCDSQDSTSHASQYKGTPDPMQAYRKRKQEQNVVKIKEANFVTPGEITQSSANILQPKKSLSRAELDLVENKIYVQKYTDLSLLQKSSSNHGLEKTSLPNSICQVHGIKKEPNRLSAEVQLGRVPHIQMQEQQQQQQSRASPHTHKLATPSVALDLISADIASEKAALDSLHLLQSLEKKRRGKPIKTRLLGTDKIISPSSPDLAARPFGVDLFKAPPGSSLNPNEVPQRQSISIMASRNNPLYPTRLFTFAPTQQHWKS